MAHFFMIRYVYDNDLGIKYSSKSLLAYLCFEAREASYDEDLIEVTRKVSTIAKKTAMSHATVRRAITELKECGILEVKENLDRHGGRAANTFRIKIPEKVTEMVMERNNS